MEHFLRELGECQYLNDRFIKLIEETIKETPVGVIPICVVRPAFAFGPLFCRPTLKPFSYYNKASFYDKI